MILQTSNLELMTTILTLLEATRPESGKNCRTLGQVRTAYRSFLQSLKQREIDTTSLEISFITGDHATSALREHFINDSLLDDRQQVLVIAPSQDDKVARKTSRLLHALDELSLYSHDYLDFLKTIVTDIFILPSEKARAGSSSQAIGLIWMNPRLTYTTNDIIEMLVHEFTHHAMFLDEMKHKHYAYEQVIDRSTWARSAILNISRPLDKVLHSIAVSTEVLLLRNRFLGHPRVPKVHPPTATMALQLDAALTESEASVRKYPHVLSERGKTILANARLVFQNEIRPLVASGCSVSITPPSPVSQAIT